jgi:hypothetical protein
VEARQLGIVSRYSDLHRIMRARAVELAISREALDDLAGLHHGYSAKLLAPKPIRKLGDLSLSCVLPALAIRLIAVADPEALERISSRLVKRQAGNASHAEQHGGTVVFQFSRRYMRSIQRKGGTNSRKYLPPKKVKELARKAGRAGAAARWKNGG